MSMFDKLIGQAPNFESLLRSARMVAVTDVTVLIIGETGTGKEVLAHALRNHSPRADRPFVTINCAALPESLAESELFGHKKGSFTGAAAQRKGKFEAADGGSIFLDEIGEISPKLQMDLLRVLQERSFERVGSVTPVPFRARLVCASNRDLASAVASGAFREDLYHRINIVTLQVPPLRERRDDIPELVQALVQQANREVGKAITSMEQAVLEELKRRDWPGNVRELEHLIKRSVLVARGPVLTIHDLSFEHETSTPTGKEKPGLDRLLGTLEAHAASLVEAARQDDSGVPVHELATRRLELALVRAALAATSGNQVAAARLLGISRSTLRSKLSE